MQSNKHIVHVFPSFGAGGVPIRITAVINALADRCRHTILSLDGTRTAAERIDPGIDHEVVVRGIDKSRPVNTLLRIAQNLRRFRPDLLLTYNWGSTEWALVNGFTQRARHIHFESGFGPEEAQRQLPRRVLFRRLALRSAERIVVPSQNLVGIVRDVWRIPPDRILYIANGVDCDRFAAPPDPGIVPGWSAPGDGRLVVGTVAPLRTEKNLSRLIHAFAGLPDACKGALLIVGDGAERDRLRETAISCGVGDRTCFAGYIAEPEKVYGLMDVFAMSSDTEQMPNALLQAMAAGRPVVATDVGDIKPIVAPENRPYVVPVDDESAYTAALRRMLESQSERAAIGAANRERARSDYAMPRMLEAYERLFLKCAS